MSFSQDVKDEISRREIGGRHCCIACLAAISDMTGRVRAVGKNGSRLCFTTENLPLARKFFTLAQKSFNIQVDAFFRVQKKAPGSIVCHIVLRGTNLAIDFFKALKSEKGDAERMELITAKSCCRKAYLSGAFLAAGSVSDPGRSYHFEIVCRSQSQAFLVKKLVESIRVEDPIRAGVVTRKKQVVVYVKESARIVDLLGLMGAYVSLMDMETLRVVRQMRGSVNRRVNCETANIGKTVSAAVRQMEDIRYIKEHGGFAALKEPLLEMAQLRLDNPDATLKELGEMLQPPVGKSGVNHRLRRLSEIADEMRDVKE